MTLEIPNKSLFKINEVCSLTGVKPYVLRFWESEFEEISPVTSSSGQKMYEHKDIEAIALIKKLLFEEKMTIEKAKAEMILRRQQPAMEAMPETEDSVISDADNFLTSMSESDRERLLMAKNKLNQMMELANSLKQRHNWM